MDGYAGKILRIDLSTPKIITESLSDKMCEEFIGGRGFVAKTLYEELPKDTDPFEKDNLFIIATGPLSGHFLPASGKTHFGSKSPATGGYADSNMGGHFGPALKYAGYDMVVLTGKAAVPSYLFIEDDKIEIRSATAYWGQGSLICEAMMKKDLGIDHSHLINGKKVLEQLKITDKGCYCCPTPCGKYGHTETALGSAYMEGPEFETISLFGGSCMLKTIEEVTYANYLCDELGIDTISGASVAAFAIECFEKGLITIDDIGKKLNSGILSPLFTC